MRFFSRRRFVGMAAATATMALSTPWVRAQDAFSAPAKLKVGIVPYISSGPFMVAQAKGYFQKLNLEVETEIFQDGGLAIPSLVGGALDVIVSTCNAGLFNAIAKGAQFRLFTDRGRESVGMGSQAMMVNNELYEQGFTDISGYKLLKGKKIGISVRGSISQLLHTKALARAGLTPEDCEWQWGVDTKSAPTLLAANHIGIANIPIPLSHAVQAKGAGKIATWSDDIMPDVQLAGWAAKETFLAEQRSVAVRYAMVHLQSVREFVEAATKGNPEIVKIIAEATRLPAEVIERARPRWTGYALDGLPNEASVIEQAKFWTDAGLVPRMLDASEIINTDIVKEAAHRLSDANPFI